VSKILIADDNLAGRNLIAKILNSAKYKVIPAKNGEEALNKFNKHRPDLVITDVKMPVMDGFELASAIRKDSSTAHVPILFISAMYKDISSKIKAIDTGGNEYLTLPVDRNELLYKVKSMLKSKALFDELLKSREISRESETKYRELFNNATDAIYLIDSESQRIIDCNPKALDMIGYSKRQIKTMTITDLFPDKEQGVVEKIFSKVAKSGSLSDITGINQLINKGARIPVEINATAFKLGNRNVILSYVRDITRHKLTEDTLNYEKNSITNILDSIEDGVYIVNDKADIQYVSPIFKKEFGSTAGRKCYEYFHNRKKACPHCKSTDVFKGKTVRWEWTSKNKRYYHIIESPLKNLDGSISKLAIYRDITELKKKEVLLKNSINSIGEELKSNKKKYISYKGGTMDQRQDIRFSPTKTCGAEIDGSLKGSIKNVSIGGLCLQSDESLIIDSIHEVELISDETMGDSIACISIWSSKALPGSIKNRKPQHLNGLKYIGLNKKTKNSLNKYINNIIN